MDGMKCGHEPCRKIAVLCALVFAALAAPLSAHADAPSVGLTLNESFGTYNTGRGDTALPRLPVPIFQLRVPIKRIEIFAEGLPPIGPLAYADGRGGRQTTKVSYGIAEVRYSFSNDRYALGLGESLLNQVSTFRTPIIEQSSRVAGFRVSARIRLSGVSGDTTDLVVAASPSMHAVQRTAVDLGFQPCPAIPNSTQPPGLCKIAAFGFNDPEGASLVDAKVVRTHPLRRLTLSYGIRYINYIAHYPLPGSPMADHERFVLPFVGLAASLGP